MFCFHYIGQKRSIFSLQLNLQFKALFSLNSINVASQLYYVVCFSLVFTYKNRTKCIHIRLNFILLFVTWFIVWLWQLWSVDDFFFLKILFIFISITYTIICSSHVNQCILLSLHPSTNSWSIYFSNLTRNCIGIHLIYMNIHLFIFSFIFT